MWVGGSLTPRCGVGSIVFLALTLGCSGSTDNGGGRGTSGSGSGVLGPSGTPGASGGAATSGGAFGNSSTPVAGGGSVNPNVTVMECASALVNTSRAMPIIEFVIDGSGSMCAMFGNSTRWKALRTALLDPTKGLIYRLQKTVSFGAALYDGTIDLTLALQLGGGGGGMGMMMGGAGQNPACAFMYVQNKAMGMCGVSVDVNPALNNAMAIDMMYPQTELGGSTPTDKAMQAVMDKLIMGRPATGPDMMAPQPTYVVLATDGAPNDICTGGMGGDGTAQRQATLAQVMRGAAAGITTWVISVASDPQLQMDLDAVAKAGDPTNPMAHTFSPNSPDELVTTLATLLGGAVGCNVVLKGMVKVGLECTGTVDLNGTKLPCCQQAQGAGGWMCDNMAAPNPNGWHLVDASTIELLGDSCTTFLTGSAEMLHASFPCNVFTPE
ncbi:MAG: hypothetical protein ACHQ53_05890 [Polyangiales bacterium]